MEAKPEDLVIGKPIGAGAFGAVYHAEWKKRKVAIKKFLVTENEAKQASDIQREIKLLGRLLDRHIVQFYGVIFHEDKLVLVMDYADGGSLQRAIEKRRLDWPAKIRIAQEIVRGLHYIHGEEILHRDLKSANVLLTKHMEVKLCDFGLAAAKAQSASKSSGDSLKGTLRWMAPELFDKRPNYSTKSDIYALGMVMWEMAANNTKPFAGHDNNALIVLFISRGDREDLPEDTPAEYRQIVERCWEGDPAKRPEAAELIKNDEVSENDEPDGHQPDSSVSISMMFSDMNSSLLSNDSTEASQSSRDQVAEADAKAGSDAEAAEYLDDLMDLLVQSPNEVVDEISLLKRRAEEGDFIAQMTLGELYENGTGVDKDFAEAFKWYLSAAEQGHAPAQHKTGQCFNRGRGTELDFGKAASWFQKAADQGHSTSQHDLGAMYEAGKGVEQDYSKAMVWFRQAAEQGHTNAQFRIGSLYENGRGVSCDMEEAMVWYRKAANGGDSFAQLQIAAMYTNGWGVEQNYAEALQWYLKMADKGDMQAQSTIGSMYARGQGVPKNIRQAIEWYSKAAEQGDRAAERRIKALEKQLPQSTAAASSKV